MSTQPTAVPGPAERAALDAALRTTGAETGFWDEHGNPAPWPDDINDWSPVTGPLGTHADPTY
jgi:hypothetical protein